MDADCGTPSAGYNNTIYMLVRLQPARITPPVLALVGKSTGHNVL
jgi:hypothetical protein